MPSDLNKKNKQKEIEGNSVDKESIIPDEILEEIPEEERGKISAIVSKTIVSGIIGRTNPIADKITPEHISQIITKADEQDKRDREERKSEQRYNLIIFIISLVFMGFLVVLFRTSEDLLLKLMISIISFAGGYGFGKSKKN